MPDQKKQHYVPKMYLRRFLFDKKRFYLFNITTMEQIGLVGYKDHCFTDYYYGKDKVWEGKLSDKEYDWDISIKQILNDDYTNVDSLREFAVFQLGRTRAYNERQIESVSKICEEFLRMELDCQNIKCEESIIQKAAERKAEDLISPSKNLDLVEKLVGEISDLSFVKIHYNTADKLISSDNPVLLMNPYFPPNAGLGVVGLIIMFPLDSSNLAIFYDDKIYPKFKGKFKVEITNNYEVAKVNALIFANAKEIVYSSVPFNERTYNKRSVDLRNENIKRNNVHALGAKNDKIIITRQPTIYHPFSFSFSTIDFFYYSIKPDYRDPVARKYDKKWQEKLFFRFQSPMINAISQANPQLNPNEYKIGYERFYKAMLKYWGVKEE